MERQLNATLKEKTSEKKGTKYYVVEIQLTPSYIKQVFLEPSDVEIVKLYTELSKNTK